MSTHSSRSTVSNPASSVSASSSSKAALLELLAPDGYYSYLGVPKPPPVTATAATLSHTTGGSNSSSTAVSEIDLDLIKKNYRKLSLRHHPDKTGGDADTFRLLNRAQKVLSNPKLRQQYDILGVDLDDDDEHEHHHRHDDEHANGSTTDNSSNGNNNDVPPPSSTQAIIQEIASNVLTTVLQVGFRTALMGLISVFIVRYWWTFYPALCFYAVIGFRVLKQLAAAHPTPLSMGASVYATLPPVLIATGLCVMYTAATNDWNKQFWIGEALVIGMFLYNSLGIPELQKNGMVLAGIAIFSLLAGLWFRGRFWNYLTVVGLVAVIAILVAIAFPIMELVLEAIINEKLRKVGDKVRHHHQVLQQHYEQQRKENQ